MKKYIPTILSALFFPTLLALAATYVPLEPGAFNGVGTDSSSNLGTFLGQVFNWAIAIAVVAALIMTIWGGIEYMTTDSWNGKEDAKTKWQNAFWGLVLALVSWLILYTINPNLVNFEGNTFLSPTSSGASNISSNTGNNTGTINNPLKLPCIDCAPASDYGLVCKVPGCQLNKALATKLQTALAGQNAQITEGYPAEEGLHISKCHYNGTCADVNLLSQSTEPDDVKKLYDSLKAAGLKAQYEVRGEDASLCQRYIEVSVPCKPWPHATAGHFHVS